MLTGKQLQNQRKEKGISQFALSGLTGVSRYNIAIFEAGHKKLKEEDQKKIVTALKKAKAPKAVKAAPKKATKKKAVKKVAKKKTAKKTAKKKAA